MCVFVRSLGQNCIRWSLSENQLHNSHLQKPSQAGDVQRKSHKRILIHAKQFSPEWKNIMMHRGARHCPASCKTCFNDLCMQEDSNLIGCVCYRRMSFFFVIVQDSVFWLKKWNFLKFSGDWCRSLAPFLWIGSSLMKSSQWILQRKPFIVSRDASPYVEHKN